ASMFIGILVFVVGSWRAEPPGAPPPHRIVSALALILATFALAGLVGWAYQPDQILGVVHTIMGHEAVRSTAPAALVPIIVMLLVWLAATQKKGERTLTGAFLFLLLFYGVFWFGLHQLGSTINIFADHDIDRDVGLGDTKWKVPATWFQVINLLLLILFAGGL